jgi:hypothetical protein
MGAVMRKSVLFILPLLLASPSWAQDGHISCRQIAALPPEALGLYVDGVMDGIGLSFAISDVTAQTLETRAASAGEKNSIEQMRRLPQEYFDPGPAVTRDDVLTAVMGRCKAEPDLTVDSVFMAVVGKS